MAATTASNLEIAKLANTHARADFATWLMMAKLGSTDALPQEAQTYHAGYLKLMERAGSVQEDAAETTIQLIYKSYYAKMGGTGTPPRIQPAPKTSVPSQPSIPTDNVTPFRRVKPSTPPASANGAKPKSKLPVALIFLGLVAVAVLFHYIKL